MYGETPEGRRRECLTSLILDLPDQDEATHILTHILGPETVWEEQDTVYSNGGGKLDVRDLCRMASNFQLEEVCRRLDIKVP